jgi:hypothetical protein
VTESASEKVRVSASATVSALEKVKAPASELDWVRVWE